MNKVAERDFVYLKEYLDTGYGTEGQLLIPRKIYDKLISEVEKNLIPRSECALYVGPAGCPGSSLDVDLETPNTMSIRKVAEGGEVPLDANEYTSTNLKPEKWGVSIRITQEMVEDAKWPLLSRQIRVAGKRFAENETEQILTVLNGCSNSVSGGSSATLANIARAVQYLDDHDYNATSLWVGNEFLYDLRLIDTFVEADKSGTTETLRQGVVGTVYGMKVFRFSTNAAPSSTYSKYGFVLDKDEAYGMVEKRPVSLAKFKMETFDMQGAVLTQRFVVKLLRDYAVCKITTS